MKKTDEIPEASGNIEIKDILDALLDQREKKSESSIFIEQRLVEEMAADSVS